MDDDELVSRPGGLSAVWVGEERRAAAEPPATCVLFEGMRRRPDGEEEAPAAATMAGAAHAAAMGAHSMNDTDPLYWISRPTVDARGSYRRRYETFAALFGDTGSERLQMTIADAMIAGAGLDALIREAYVGVKS